MATNLKRIGAYVEKHPDAVLTSLYHHVTDVDNLLSCYEALDGAKAAGVDGIGKEEYHNSVKRVIFGLNNRKFNSVFFSQIQLNSSP